MKPIIISSVVTVTLLAIINVSVASDVIVFPANGQSNEKMETDKHACYGWA